VGGVTVTRPTMDEILREMAVLMARRGTCSRRAVGAVAARDGRIVSSGYNGAPAGMPHCDHDEWTWSLTGPVVIPGWVQAVVRQPLKRGMTVRRDGDQIWIGQDTADAPTCRVAVHAEANLVAFTARHGVALDATSIYTTDSPCVECAKLLINAGVIRVVALHEYRDPAGVELLRAAGVAVAPMLGS
jgi:dCMP deaminase